MIDVNKIDYFGYYYRTGFGHSTDQMWQVFSKPYDNEVFIGTFPFSGETAIVKIDEIEPVPEHLIVAARLKGDI